MSEGGLFLWKVQKVRSKPVADYSKMSLPPPPFGQTWQQDLQTKEYKLVPYLVEGSQKSQTQVVVDLSEQPRSNVTGDWELLSDAAVAIDSPTSNAVGDNANGDSTGSSGNPNQEADIPVAVAGVVGSVDIVDGSHNSNNVVAGVVPALKIQRLPSNSTIDSNDTDGPSRKGVLGVDYLEHIVMPTDTLQGICIAYKISSTRLCQINRFSGNSLVLAPKKLIIPISKQAHATGSVPSQDTNAKEYKVNYFLAEFEIKFGVSEARAYLELADWDLKSAINLAKEDIKWERETGGKNGQKLTKAETQNAVSSAGDAQTLKGAGISSSQRSTSPTCVLQPQDVDGSEGLSRDNDGLELNEMSKLLS